MSGWILWGFRLPEPESSPLAEQDAAAERQASTKYLGASNRICHTDNDEKVKERVKVNLVAVFTIPHSTQFGS